MYIVVLCCYYAFTGTQSKLPERENKTHRFIHHQLATTNTLLYLHLNETLSRIKGLRQLRDVERKWGLIGLHTTHLSSLDGGAALLSSGDNSAPVGVWGALSTDERLLSISGYYCGRPLTCITWTLIYVLTSLFPLYGECLNHWIPYCSRNALVHSHHCNSHTGTHKLHVH